MGLLFQRVRRSRHSVGRPTANGARQPCVQQTHLTLEQVAALPWRPLPSSSEKHPFEPFWIPELSGIDKWKVDLMSARPFDGIHFGAYDPVGRMIKKNRWVYEMSGVGNSAVAVECFYSIEYDGLTMDILACKPEGEDG